MCTYCQRLHIGSLCSFVFWTVLLKMADAQHYKEEGNKFFNESNFGEALACYTKALSVCGISDGEKAVYLKNRAACFLKLNKNHEAVTDCTVGESIYLGICKSSLLLDFCYSYSC